MTFRIAVVSGKGGAGKTTVAIGLARACAEAGEAVTLVDADAEAPDAGIGVPVAWTAEAPVRLEVPAIDAGRCDGCGRCAAACRFNALAMAGGRPVLVTGLCHGCGACALVCRRHRDAIRPGLHGIGTVRRGTAPWGDLVEARTAIGAARTPQVIAEALAQSGDGVTVVDGPPGSACSAVAAVAGAAIAVVVVESTPFGRHDARLILDLLQARGVPARIVLNRVLPDEVEDARRWCAGIGMPLLALIPEDPGLDRAGAFGLDAGDASRGFAAICWAMAHTLLALRPTPEINGAH